LATIEGGDKPLRVLAFSADAKKIASGGLEGTIRLLDIGTKKELGSFRPHRVNIDALAFSPDGGTLASGGGGERIKLNDVDPLRERDGTLYRCDSRQCLVYSPDGKMLATEGGRFVNVLDVSRGKRRIMKLGDHDGPIECIAFSPDGELLATASQDKTIKLWKIKPDE
jgi:COMPASS component SWD3